MLAESRSVEIQASRVPNDCRLPKYVTGADRHLERIRAPSSIIDAKPRATTGPYLRITEVFWLLLIVVEPARRYRRATADGHADASYQP
jgi:hypothetical protein